MRRARYPLLAILMISLVSCGQRPREVTERPWHEYRTPHFIVYSDIYGPRAKQLAINLERFRKVVEYVTGQEIADAAVMTRVIVFEKAWAFKRFRPSARYGAYFKEGLRSNHLVMPSAWGSADVTRTTSQHEYSHFVIENHRGFAYPSCYNEGFAEFLSTVRMDSKQVQIGVPIRAKVTRWTPFEELLDRRIRDFPEYFQCWGLVHYLSFGSSHSSNNLGKLTGYFRRRARGVPTDQAILESFGMTPKELDRTVRKYMESEDRRYITVDAARFGRDAEVSDRVVPPEELPVVLGDLLIQLGRAGDAELYYRESLSIDPNYARAHAGLGVARLGREDYEGAEAHYLRALELDPDDPLNHIDYAAYLAAKAEESSSDEERAELARKARKSYARAWKLDDSTPEVYARNGATYLLEGQKTEKARKSLERAYEMLPGNWETQLLLAEFYSKLEDKDQALPLLRRVVAESHEGSLPDWAKELLEEAGDR